MGSGSIGMIRPISVPLPTQPWNVPRLKGPGSCWEGTRFFKAAFVSIRSQVQPGEQRFPNLSGPLREPNQLVLRLAPAGWVAPVRPGLAQLQDANAAAGRAHLRGPRRCKRSRDL